MPFRGFYRPGRGFKPYTVLRRKGGMTASGRPVAGKWEPDGVIYGIISQANQQELAKWKQEIHPITHTVIQWGIRDAAQADDVLELRETGPDEIETVRRFKVKGRRDPGEIHHFMVYATEEREDLQ